MYSRSSGSKIWKNAAIEINGEEVLATLHYFLQPPEPDVGCPGSVELESIIVDGKEVVFDLTDDEIEQVTQTIIGVAYE